MRTLKPASTYNNYFWLTNAIITVTLILYWRRPDAFYNPQLWAEDGNRIFNAAYFSGAQSLFIPFAGYYHTIARIVALIGSWLPLFYIPYWYSLTSLLLLLGVVAYIYSSRLELSPTSRFFLSISLVAVTPNNEVFFNLANWATITTLYWLVLCISTEPISRRQTIFDYTVLFLTGLNSPFAISLWPAFLLRWLLWHKSAHSRNLFFGSLGVALIQVSNMGERATFKGELPPFTIDLADILISRFGYLFLGDQVYQIQLTDPLRIYSLIAIVAVLAALIVHALRTRNWRMLIMIGAGFMVASLSAFTMRHHSDRIIVAVGRHYYLPAIIAAWVFVLSEIRSWYFRWLPFGMMVAAFMFLTPSTKMDTRADLDWAGHVASCTGTRQSCYIPIHPVQDPPAWFAVIDSHVFAHPAVSNKFESSFDNTIQLVGYDLDQDSTNLNLTLHWHALGTMQIDYKYFVHIRDAYAPSDVSAQLDAMPLDWHYPTQFWVKDEYISDPISIDLSNIPSGEYTIVLGWYNPSDPTASRLLATDEQGQAWENNQVTLPSRITIR